MKKLIIILIVVALAAATLATTATVSAKDDRVVVYEIALSKALGPDELIEGRVTIYKNRDVEIEFISGESNKEYGAFMAHGGVNPLQMERVQIPLHEYIGSLITTDENGKGEASFNLDDLDINTETYPWVIAPNFIIRTPGPPPTGGAEFHTAIPLLEQEE